MKLSDYVWQFVKDNVADTVFLVSGGGIMHLVDSAGKSGLRTCCCHHEQGAVVAAEGYGRIKNSPGVALVTTGPGGTNAATGIAGAWLDSVPLLVVGGQVKRADIAPTKNGKPLVRQIGMQELNVTDVVRPITKYCVTVLDEKDIRYHLEKAVYLATHGRPGPVFVEIPLDVQAAEIDPKNLKGFDSSELKEKNLAPDKVVMSKIVKLLRQAKRPLFMVGYGIRLAGGEEALRKFLEKTKINAVTPIFTADDLVTYDYPYYLGRQGMVGNITANFAIDNCDLLLVIGERLQITQTSWENTKFAAQAKKIMVDIDENELRKKTIKVDVPVHCDAKIFLEELAKQEIKLNRWDVKVELIDAPKYAGDKKYLNVYAFLGELSELIKNEHVATANGMASVASHQALRVRPGERFITNAGLGHMGSGLPMAIGAAFADNKPVICMEGDGSLMMNIQELQTAKHHRLPLKIFIFNNNGYYSIRGTHLKFFNKIFAADPSSGVTLPDFSKLAPAWGLAYERINNDKELVKLPKVMSHKGPIVCELMLDPDQPLLERWSAGSLA